MCEEWQSRTLSTAFDFSSGKKPPNSNGTVLVFGANGPIGFCDEANVVGPALLVGRVGAAGAVHEIHETVWASDNTLVLQPLTDHPKFLKYLLQVLDLPSLSTQTAQPLITQSRLKALSAKFPPLAEQKKIAEILGSVDDAIAATKAVIEQTKQVKKGLLQELLTKGIGHTKFKQTEIGEIPQSWGVELLDDVNNRDRPICYGILKPGQGFLNGIPVIKVKDIYDNRIDDTGLLRTDPAIDAQYRRSRLRSGDILLTIRGSTGRVARVPHHLEGANITQDSARIDAVGVDPDFLFFALQSPEIQRQIQHNTIGQAVKGINIAEVRKLNIPIPPINEQQRITDILQAVEVTLRAESLRMSEIVSIKAGLLHDLLTGKVRVSV